MMSYFPDCYWSSLSFLSVSTFEEVGACCSFPMQDLTGNVFKLSLFMASEEISGVIPMPDTTVIRAGLGDSQPENTSVSKVPHWNSVAS
jgi:hypothetical protein